MAYSTGTASDLADLHGKIRTFALAQGWVDVYYDAGVTWIGKGPGDDGNDEVYVEISTHYDTGSSIWCFKIQGAMGYRTGATSLNFFNNVGPYYVSLWDSSMTYWLTINGRRISFVIKVSTVYALGYLGFLRPMGTREQYPYPMFIGGTTDTQRTWTDSLNTSFLIDEDFCGLIAPGGSIRGSKGYVTISGYPQNLMDLISFPWWGYDFNDKIGPAIDGSYVLYAGYPLIVTGQAQNIYNDSKGTAGLYDGIFWVTGKDQSAENIITVGADNYAVFPCFSTTDIDSWFAFKLE